jgi:hypothetical protein
VEEAIPRVALFGRRHDLELLIQADALNDIERRRSRDEKLAVMIVRKIKKAP